MEALKFFILVLIISPLTAIAQKSHPEIEWEKTYGGSSRDLARTIIQTSDGGYAVCGTTQSKGAGDRDSWVIKLNSLGIIEWEKTFGGSEFDMTYSLIQTSDGGYAVCGATQSKGAGYSDFWVIKLNNQGTKEWEKTFGGPEFDMTSSMIQSSDGGYAVCGYTHSKGAGDSDAWVIKLNSHGAIEWEKTFGGSKIDMTSSMIQSSDGGYAVCGYTHSKGAGQSDFWVIKLNRQGTLEWENTFGASLSDGAYSIIQTNDGGYAVCGYTRIPISNSDSFGDSDACIIKLNSQGTIEWEKTFGGSYLSTDYLSSMIQTSDGGYAVCGGTESKGAGSEDVWVIKLSGTESYVTSKYNESLQITVNVDMNIPQTKMVNNNAIAVVIGNRGYEMTKQVTFAINDARAIRNYLIKTFGFMSGNIFFVENATQGEFRTYFGIVENHKGKLYMKIFRR